MNISLVFVSVHAINLILIAVECRNLLAPGDGKIIGSNHSYNDEVSFSCNDGFILDGELTLRCQHDGTWSSAPPTCHG